ncbi:c-type cytochrome [Variovorax sp. KK3]|uniref:c-type cytochrome n=1 Tax=Variovorax sp. KK3 TaxID=1855728 RepID=UPI00097BE336|nr:c-type cytochrome [Variovorax sp. KK3]
MRLHRTAIAALGFIVACATCAAAEAAPPAPGKNQIERGRHLVRIAGCNDCHTPGYGPKNGQVDEKLWLTGDALGWSGPWGTTYATNLRISLASMTERQWLDYARRMEPRPPMPWFNVRRMTDAELKAIYAFTRSLGPGGEAAPAYVPPGQKVQGPVVQFPQ